MDVGESGWEIQQERESTRRLQKSLLGRQLEEDPSEVLWREMGEHR